MLCFQLCDLDANAFLLSFTCNVLQGNYPNVYRAVKRAEVFLDDSNGGLVTSAVMQSMAAMPAQRTTVATVLGIMPTKFAR